MYCVCIRLLDLSRYKLLYLVCNMRKGSFGRLRKVSFQISLCSPHRLIWNDTFCFMYLFCLQHAYFSTKSNGVVKLLRKCPKVPFCALQVIYGWISRSKNFQNFYLSSCDFALVLTIRQRRINYLPEPNFNSKDEQTSGFFWPGFQNYLTQLSSIPFPKQSLVFTCLQ